MRLKDTKGKESTTLTFVFPAFFVLLFKFAFEGLKINGLEIPPMSAAEFGAAMALIIGLWLNREWKEAKHGQD